MGSFTGCVGEIQSYLTVQPGTAIQIVTRETREMKTDRDG